MLLDFGRTGDTTTFEADICIVGSGAAGLTLACHLGRHLRVLVVEAGGRRPGTDGLAGEAAAWPFTGFEQGRARAYRRRHPAVGGAVHPARPDRFRAAGLGAP